MVLFNAARSVSRSVGGRYTAALAAIVLLVATFTGLTSAANASSDSGCATRVVDAPAGMLGIARPARVGVATCADTLRSDPHAPGMRPPLLFHGGNLMSTPGTEDTVTITPIFWAPTGYGFASGYRTVINQYLNDVAKDSEQPSNVFSTLFEYKGLNGYVNYSVKRGSPILDRNRFPAAGCTRNAGAIYSDKASYKTCLDDAQVRAEINKQVKARSLTHGLGNIYVMLLPKRVEACFLPRNPRDQQCSLNYSPSAAFCGYHSETATHVVYANLPYAIYHSPTRYTCGNDGSTDFAREQAPNGNLDADAEVSPLSHEVSEAITDPDGRGWFDKAYNENGDECAYMYGAAHGKAGGKWNQTIHGDHYLTQEEFSNHDYALNHLNGCMQNYVPASVPKLTSLSTTINSNGDVTTLTITGTTLAGATGVTIGGAAVDALSVVTTDSTELQVPVPPATETGQVDVTVQNIKGTSNVLQFTYS